MPNFQTKKVVNDEINDLEESEKVLNTLTYSLKGDKVIEKYECKDFSFTSLKYLETKKGFISTDILMIEYCKNSYGDAYELHVNDSGHITYLKYLFNDIENEIVFYNKNNTIHVIDSFNYNKTFGCYTSKNIYECSNMLEVIKNIRRNNIGEMILGYSFLNIELFQ